LKNKSFITKLLNLEEGEKEQILLPFLYSFFSGASLSFFVTSSTSLFLSSFDREMLPIVFIASGVFVWLIGIVYSFYQQRITFSKSIKYGIAFLLVTIILFLSIYIGTGSLIIVFILYAWIRVFAYLHAVSFWGMLGKIFSLQQGKRLFGLITGGEVLASILSFFSIPFLLQLISTEEVLLISGVFLLIAYFLIILLVKKNEKKLQVVKTQKIYIEEVEKKKISFLDNKYYRLFFLIAFIPIFAQFFVDFIFQAQAKVEFPDKEELTAFVGVFFGVSAIVEFVLKTIISGRLMNKYGMRLGLLAFPVVLLFSFSLVSVIGLFYGTISFFFSLVALGRLFTRAVRTSFNDPATQILFQALPQDERIAFQNKVESGPKAYASIVAGVLLFIFVKIPQMNLVFISIFLLGVIILWIISAKDIIVEYRLMLQNVLKEKQLGISTSKFDRVFEHLKNFIINAQNNSQLSIIKLARIIFPYRTYALVEERKIQLFKTSKDDYNFTELIEFSKDSDPTKRRIAAEEFANFQVYKVERLLKRLLTDENFRVRTEAIITSGKMKDKEFFQYLINNFNSPEYRDTSASAMIYVGEDIIPDLTQVFKRIGFDINYQLKTVEILREIGGEKAIKFLKSNLNHPNPKINKYITSALGMLDYRATLSESPYFSNQLEEEIDNFVYAVTCLTDLESIDNDNSILSALLAEKEDKLNKIFAVLTVLYDTTAIYLIKENIESKDVNARGFALEIADMTISEIHKNLLLPILNDLPYSEIIKSYRFLFSYPKLEVADRLIHILNSSSSRTSEYTKASALDYFAQMESSNKLSVLNTNIVHPSALVRGVAGYYLKMENQAIFDEVVLFNRHRIPSLIDLSINLNSDVSEEVLIYSKINHLRKYDLFKLLDLNAIVRFAESLEVFFLSKNQEIVINPNNASISYVHISGILEETEFNRSIPQGQILSIYDTKDNLRELKYKALTDCILYKAQIYLLNNILVENEAFAEKYIHFIWSN